MTMERGINRQQMEEEPIGKLQEISFQSKRYQSRAQIYQSRLCAVEYIPAC